VDLRGGRPVTGVPTAIISGRYIWMIVAGRQKRKCYFWSLLSRRDNQADDLIVARDGGRPGPGARSMAARRR
jgi:hypothetical protein